MKLLFKQRAFSWFDSYDIYNEHGETVFTVTPFFLAIAIMFEGTEAPSAIRRESAALFAFNASRTGLRPATNSVLRGFIYITLRKYSSAYSRGQRRFLLPQSFP